MHATRSRADNAPWHNRTRGLGRSAAKPALPLASRTPRSGSRLGSGVGLAAVSLSGLAPRVSRARRRDTHTPTRNSLAGYSSARSRTVALALGSLVYWSTEISTRQSISADIDYIDFPFRFCLLLLSLLSHDARGHLLKRRTPCHQLCRGSFTLAAALFVCPRRLLLVFQGHGCKITRGSKATTSWLHG